MILPSIFHIATHISMKHSSLVSSYRSRACWKEKIWRKEKLWEPCAICPRKRVIILISWMSVFFVFEIIWFPLFELCHKNMILLLDYNIMAYYLLASPDLNEVLIKFIFVCNVSLVHSNVLTHEQKHVLTKLLLN